MACGVTQWLLLVTAGSISFSLIPRFTCGSQNLELQKLDSSSWLFGSCMHRWPFAGVQFCIADISAHLQ